jgi:hypothetical protein
MLTSVSPCPVASGLGDHEELNRRYPRQGYDGSCPLSHPMHFELSFLEFNGIQ